MRRTKKLVAVLGTATVLAVAGGVGAVAFASGGDGGDDGDVTVTGTAGRQGHRRRAGGDPRRHRELGRA